MTNKHRLGSACSFCVFNFEVLARWLPMLLIIVFFFLLLLPTSLMINSPNVLHLNQCSIIIGY